jgi:hypothetical protein
VADAVIKAHLLIERLALGIRGKRQEHLRHIHNLSLVEGKLRHDPVSDITPRHPVDVLLLIPPPHLLKLQYTLKLAPVYRQRKGNIFILDTQEELEFLDTSRALLVFIEHSSCAMLYGASCISVILRFAGTVVV